ncbi:MAG: hypothetical protein ACRBCK_00640 [Alphaproteobacteria bacterium]
MGITSVASAVSSSSVSSSVETAKQIQDQAIAEHQAETPTVTAATNIVNISA